VTTIHQARSNARNAAHSTGPTSDDGKARSSRNALQHGAYARVDPLTSGLLGEDPAEVQAIVDGVVGDLDPANTIERISAMTVAQRLVGQHRVAKLLAPLVMGLQTTHQENFEVSDHRDEYQLAHNLLAVIDWFVNEEDWGSDSAPAGWDLFFLERMLWMRVDPDPTLTPSNPVFRDEHGVARKPTEDEQYMAGFVRSVFERFTSWDDARRWAEDLRATHEPGALEETRRLQLAETERIMEGLERYGPIQDGTDRRLTRALANHETIRRQSARETT